MLCLQRPLGAFASLLLLTALGSCGAPSQFFTAREGGVLFDVSLASAPDLGTAPVPEDGAGASSEAAVPENEGEGARESVSPSLRRSLAPGSVLEPGERIEAVCQPLSGGAEVDEIQLSLLRGGQVLATAVYTADTLSGELLGAGLGFSLPLGLDSGLYALGVEIRFQGDSLFQSETELFVLSAPFRVGAVLACPGRVEPASLAVLEASLDAEEGLDPWLVWSRDGQTILEGFLSGGAAQLLWASPAAEGIYQITLSAWPEGPSDGLSFSYAAPASFTTSLVVADMRPEPLDPLSHPDDFHALFRFTGNFQEATGRVPASAVEAFGKPAIRIFGPGYGYLMGPQAGMRAADSLLPQKEGSLSPLSIILRAQPESGSDGELLRSQAGDFGLRLSIIEGELCLDVSQGTASERSRSGIFPAGRLLNLILSLEPWRGGLFVTWFSDDRELSSTFLAVDPSGLEGPGEFSLGGPGSAPAIYDDLGLYSRKLQGGGRDIWASSFRAESERRFPGALAFAEGFDSAFSPAGLGSAGSLVKLPGALLLEKGAYLAFPLDAPWTEGLRIEAFPAGQALTSGLREGEIALEPALLYFSLASADASLLDFFADGRVLLPDGTQVARMPPLDAARMAFSLALDPRGLRITHGKIFTHIDISLPEEALFLRFGSLEAPFVLSAFRAYRSPVLEALSSLPPAVAKPVQG